MRIRSGRSLVLAVLAACSVASCAETRVVAPDALPLELQVRNSGLPGGYVWLSMTGHPDTGRWHPFGMAEFFCVTCPIPFEEAGGSYEIAILDEACSVLSTERTTGGQLLVEIDPGPVIKLVEAKPLGDWLPGDSAPADPAGIPCPIP